MTVLLGEPGLAELIDDGAEEAVGDSEVEYGVALCAVSSFHLVQHVADPTVDLGLGEIARDVRHLVREPCPRRLVDTGDVEFRGGVADEALQHAVEAVAPLFGGTFAVADADQREVFRQHFAVRKVIEGRHHQTLREIAACTEDHHGARIGRLRPPARRRLHPLRGRRDAYRLGVRHPGRSYRGVASIEPAATSRGARSPAISARRRWPTTPSNLSKESAKARTPSSTSSSVILSREMPWFSSMPRRMRAPARSCSTASGLTTPWSRKASIVAGGMVSTVSRPISSSTYIVSL